ncbi:hypothetical protein IV01_24340 [Pseudomonas syringae]|uniref:Uncharacterized protein n=1 Tax=Pseudomonas syringae TaxID=317 RepID=A0A085V7G9_PSESX|nr:hypothetical protein IV01_24340 [Pseudomonas syringae]
MAGRTLLQLAELVVLEINLQIALDDILHAATVVVIVSSGEPIADFAGALAPLPRASVVGFSCLA